MKMLVTNENTKKAILYALADDEMLKILNSTKKDSKSAIELMMEHSISHSTAYRKIKWLLYSGLLVVERIELREDGKKSSLLKSTFKSIDVKYQDDKVAIEVEENVKRLNLTAKQFFSMEE